MAYLCEFVAGVAGSPRSRFTDLFIAPPVAAGRRARMAAILLTTWADRSQYSTSKHPQLESFKRTFTSYDNSNGPIQGDSHDKNGGGDIV